MPTYGPVGSCQISDSKNLKSVLFLGYIPPVNTMREIDSIADQELCFPAQLLYCPDSHLVQLGYTVDPKILFPPEYPYTSGTTRILRENFAELYKDVQVNVGLAPEDLVIDIGSNDGTLLGNFAQNHRVVGIEPSLTAKLAQEKNIPTVMAFFDQASVDKVKLEYGPAKLVTATNVFAHIADVHDVVSQIEQLLTDEGVFVSESHYLLDLVNTLQYDTIYHEHLRYYSLHSLDYLLRAHGLRIFHVKRIPTHGGSIRVYASKSEKYVLQPSVASLLQEEIAAELTSDRWIADFRSKVTRSKLELYNLLADIKEQGVPIYGIGAPSRASTLINYVGLDDDIIDCVMEIKGSQKIGKYIPGRRIPVLDETKLYTEQPPYVLLLSWHITEELCRNLKKRGYKGDFIVPLPSPQVIKNSDVTVS